MSSVIVNEGGSVIEHDEIIYPQESKHEHKHDHDHDHDHDHEHKPGKECCSRTIKISLHFH